MLFYLALFAALVVAVLSVESQMDRRARRRFEASAAGNCGSCYNTGHVSIHGCQINCGRCLGMAGTSAGRDHLAAMLGLNPELKVPTAARLDFDTLQRVGVLA